MRGRSRIAVALLIAAATACSSRAQREERSAPPVVVIDPEGSGESLAEREPNDTRATAQKVEAGLEIKGAFQSEKDEDWYRVSSAPGVLRCWLRGAEGVDVVLEAFDALGKRLVKVDSEGPGGAEVLPNLLLKGEATYLRASAKKATEGGTSAPRDYMLRYELRAVDPGEESEPNWKKELASPLTIGEDAVGYFGWKTDSDWYKATLPPTTAGVLRAELEGVDGVWSFLELRDGRGKLLQRRRGRPGATVVLANVTKPADAEIYVVARTFRTFNVEARYSVRLFIESGRPGEREPNDRPEQASALKEGEAAHGSLTDDYDRDYFRLAVSQERLVWLEASPSFGLDLALAVVDDNGKVSKEINAAQAGGRESLASVLARPPGLTVRLRAPRADGAGVAGRYILSARTRDPSGFEQEPNDEAATACPMRQSSGGEVMGYIHPVGDVDYFKLPGGSADLRLKITPPPGVEIKANVERAGQRALAVGQGGAPFVLHIPGGGGSEALLRIEGRKGSDAQRPYRIVGDGPVAPLPLPATPAAKEIRR